MKLDFELIKEAANDFKAKNIVKFLKEGYYIMKADGVLEDDNPLIKVIYARTSGPVVMDENFLEPFHNFNGHEIPVEYIYRGTTRAAAS